MRNMCNSNTHHIKFNVALCPETIRTIGDREPRMVT